MKILSRWAVSAVIFAFATSACLAQIPDKVKDFTVSLSTEFESQYVGYGNGAVFYNKPMTQIDLFVQHKSGIHADIWWGTGFNDNLISSGWDDEIDWNVGFSHDFLVGQRKFCVDIGVGYWDVFDTFFHQSRNDIIHPYVEVAHPIMVRTNLTITPFYKFEGYLLLFGTDYEEGTITSAGMKYCWNFYRHLSITGLTSFGYDDGGFGFQRGVIWKDYLNLEWCMSDHVTWQVAKFQFYIPLNVGDREAQQVYGTGFCFRF